MAQRIHTRLAKTIGAIARIYFVLVKLFHTFKSLDAGEGYLPDTPIINWQTLPIRQQIIKWLDSQGITWELCEQFANEHLMMGYLGQIYIDLPYDQNLPAYRELQTFLENQDGTNRYPDAWFCYCPLENALRNAAHDEPGFWDKDNNF